MRYWRPLAAPVTVASMLRKDRHTLLGGAARLVADTLKPLTRPAAGLVIVRADSAIYAAEKSPRLAAAAPICHYRPARPGRGLPIAFIPEEAWTQINTRTQSSTEHLQLWVSDAESRR